MAEFDCALKYSDRSQSNKSPTLISGKFDSQDCPSSSHPTGLGARRLFWPVVEEGAIGLQGEKLSCSTLVRVNNTTVNATKSFIYCEYWIGDASNLSCFASSTSRCFRTMWSYRQSYSQWLSASKETQQVAPWPWGHEADSQNVKRRRRFHSSLLEKQNVYCHQEPRCAGTGALAEWVSAVMKGCGKNTECGISMWFKKNICVLIVSLQMVKHTGDCGLCIYTHGRRHRWPGWVLHSCKRRRLECSDAWAC